MAKSDLDFYQILGVTRHSSDDEIKKAFRKLGMFGLVLFSSKSVLE